MATLLALAEQYAKANPKRDGATWNQWCASLMVRFNNLPGAYPSAIIAYHASKIESANYNKAPVGAFHFWDIGEFGHVAQDLTAGGRTVFMASARTDASWGDAIGIASVAGYTNRTGAKYLGWSLKFGSMSPRSASDLGHLYSAATVKTPATSTAKWKWSVPDKATQKAIQTALKKRERYTGLEDGVWGVNSVKGIQLTIRNVGYEGLIDGLAGEMTCHYVQVYAEKFGGYKGPIDNKPAENSWAAFLKGVK